MGEFNLATKAQEAEQFLKSYGYDRANADAIRCIFNNWYSAKGQLRSRLRAHPNWDEEQQAIIFSSDIECGINTEAIGAFARWANREYRKIFFEKNGSAEYDGVLVSDIISKSGMFGDILQQMGPLYTLLKYYKLEDKLQIGQLTTKNIQALYHKYYSLRDKMTENYYADTDVMKIVSNQQYREMAKVLNFIDSLTELDTSLVTEAFAGQVRDLFPDINVVEGQKVSRVINKIGKYLGLAEIKQWKPVIHNGQTQEKDYGWNYQFASFADAINPIKITQYTVVSINPFDYWTMSFGSSWASCHTIDKDNYRGRALNGEHTYNGCYSAGTESYMLDNSTVIFYTVRPEYKGEMWKAPKGRRCTFHVSENGECFIQGRVYPDGRDGGEAGISAAFRNIFEKVWSECTNEPNLWKVEKGTRMCSRYSNSCGQHYRDYREYEDCCYVSRKGSELVAINIGANAICPVCGYEHYLQESIVCEDCQHETKECEHCGCRFDPQEDDFVLTDDGTWFCCDDCARAAGYVYADNVGVWVPEDNCYYDDYSEEYYNDMPEVTTVDGHCYYTTENARRAGYVKCEDTDEWVQEDDAYFENLTCLYYEDDSDGVETVDGNWFHNPETAKECGYTENEDGDWVKGVA